MRRPKPRLGPGVSVELDWAGALPEAHLAVFRANSKELEASLGMLGVSLNEAVMLYRSGSLALSFEGVILASGLCRRFSETLDNVLRSLTEHSEANGIVPSVASLKPADYHTHCGLNSALANSLRNLTDVSQHKRFLNKLKALRAMVKRIGDDVCASADILGSHGATVVREPHWLVMTEGYWDLNTCLRESLVSLKCFLRVLPEEQLSGFRDDVSERKTRKARQG